HETTMAFYALAYFMFNAGPNTLTFVLAGECFPTEFRGTSYGIAAAAGKIGAMVARGIVEAVAKDRDGLVTILSAFSAILFIMSLLIWFQPYGIGFPRIQEGRSQQWEDADFFNKIWYSRLNNKSLENIAPWVAGEPTEQT